MITKIIEEEQIQKASKYIEKGKSFAIVSHVSPDGDALGSSLALSHYLKACGKEKVFIIMPNSFPSFFKWMPGADGIINFERQEANALRRIFKADVIFCLDFNAAKRVNDMSKPLLKAQGRKIMIDHHLFPDDFCKVVISHPEISSTSELIFRFICQLGTYDLLSKEMAECIYTGMMTDTGAFSYNSNHPEIYTIISELIKKGIDKDEIYRKVYQVYSEDRLNLQGYVLYKKMKVFPKAQTALISLSKEELDQFHYHAGDSEGFVNMPLSIKGVTFSAFLREDKNIIKVSLRSTGDFPCNEFAARFFHGGGHKNASGGEFIGTLEQAIALFEEGMNAFNPEIWEEKEK